MQHPIDAAGPGPAFSRATLAEQVYEHLRQGILANAYPPATPLPEEALAARLNVSRVPVREALRRLASDGLVNLAPRQGAVVSSLTPKQFLDAYRLRESLEALAVRLAIPRFTGDDLQSLDWRQVEMRAAAAERDVEQFSAANAAFHALFVERSDNDYLRAVYDPLVDQMRRYRSPTADLRGGLERSIDDHERILAAVRRGEIDDATQLMVAHLRVPQRILEENGDQPLAPSR